MNRRYALKSEDTEQIAVIDWARWNEGKHPELKWLYHVPNGGSRNKLEAVKLKQMGVRAGVSDLCLPYPKGIYCGLYIEMKYGTNRQQDSQKSFLNDMEKAGHYVATCYSADAAIKVLEKYLGLISATCPMYPEEMLKRMVMPEENNSIFKDGRIKRSGK